jgi:hypothetical protein
MTGAIGDKGHGLAKVGGHTVIPAGYGGFEVVDLGPGIIDNVSPHQLIIYAVGYNLPHSSPETPGHGDIDRRHCDAEVTENLSPRSFAVNIKERSKKRKRRRENGR